MCACFTRRTTSVSINVLLDRPASIPAPRTRSSSLRYMMAMEDSIPDLQAAAVPNISRTEYVEEQRLLYSARQRGLHVPDVMDNSTQTTDVRVSQPLRHGYDTSLTRTPPPRSPPLLRPMMAMEDRIPDTSRAVNAEAFDAKDECIERPDGLVPVVVGNKTQTVEQQCIPKPLANAAGRIFGILEVPVVLIFGILLYLVDVGTDIAAAVSYFQEGHQLWGSLAVTFVVFPCICSAAFSWTYWYLGNKKEDVNPTTRKVMMVLSVLLLEPLVR